MKQYKSKAADRKKIIKARDIIADEFNKPFSLNRLGRRVGMSPKKLHVLFKESQMFTPYEYMIEHRANEGLILLLENKLRIYEIAWACGYETTEPFSRMYKRFSGMAPSKWRKLQLSAPKGTYPFIMKPLFPGEPIRM
jgi:AraC-like DNA-binding protein